MTLCMCVHPLDGPAQIFPGKGFILHNFTSLLNYQVIFKVKFCLCSAAVVQGEKNTVHS